MKKILVTALLMATSFTTSADEIRDMLVQELCYQKSKLSMTTMEMRQSGYEMAEVMQKMKGDTSLTVMVVKAYMKPEAKTDAEFEEVMKVFPQEVYDDCMEENMK